MSNLAWIGVIFVVFILLVGILNLFGLDMDVQLEESFYPHRGHRGGRGGRGWRRHHRPGRHYGPGRHHGGRRGWGWWPGTWWGAGAPFVRYSGGCPNGCMNIGRGVWGCPIPGRGPGDCLFASDCQYCNRGWLW